MLKNVLKITVVCLLFVCIAIVPLLGVSFYDSPSIFKENALALDRHFGGGTAIYLTFKEEDAGDITEEDYAKIANVLKERFVATGYVDATTEVTEDKLIRVDIAQRTYLDTIVSEVGAVGSWKFVGGDMSTELCDASMVQDAYVTKNSGGTYSVTLKFTEEGAKKFQSNTSSYAISSASFYFMLNGQFMGIASVKNSDLKETFTFGNYEFQSASMVASIIKNGELPAAAVIAKTEPLPSSMGTVGSIVCAVVSAVIILAACGFLIVKGRTLGLFASLAMFANVAVLATAVANYSILLNLYTLIASLVYLGAITVLLAFALDLYKKGGIVSLTKFNTKVILIHAGVFLISLFVMMFASSTFLYMMKTMFILSLSNFVLYFIFFYFSAHTIWQMRNPKLKK